MSTTKTKGWRPHYGADAKFFTAFLVLLLVAFIGYMGGDEGIGEAFTRFAGISLLAWGLFAIIRAATRAGRK